MISHHLIMELEVENSLSDYLVLLEYNKYVLTHLLFMWKKEIRIYYIPGILNNFQIHLSYINYLIFFRKIAISWKLLWVFKCFIIKLIINLAFSTLFSPISSTDSPQKNERKKLSFIFFYLTQEKGNCTLKVALL